MGEQGDKENWTYDLTSLPELHNIDNLLPRTNRESHSGHHLRPVQVLQHVDYAAHQLGVSGSEVRGEESGGNGEIGHQWSYPVVIKVEADEEEFVGETKDEEGALFY